MATRIHANYNSRLAFSSDTQAELKREGEPCAPLLSCGTLRCTRPMLKSSLLCVLLCSTSLQAHAQQSTASATDASTQAARPSLEQAQHLFAQGKLEQSLAEADSLAKQTPEPDGTEHLRGLIYYQQNKFLDADAAFAKALVQNPKD